MARIYPDNLPSKYVHDHHTQVSGWVQGEYGRLLAAYAPRVFPGAPWTACLGFASNGSVDERTSANELGTFGIEGARYEGLRRDPTVVSLLGRPAAADPGWMGSRGGLADQIACGLVNQRRHAAGVRAALSAALRSTPASAWDLALSFAGWSAGDGGAAHHVQQYASQLAGVPEDSRFQVWGRLLAHDLVEGRIRPGTASSYSYPFHTWIRTQQKIRCSVDAGCPASWFMNGSDNDLLWIEDVVARAASGLSVSGVPSAPGLSAGLSTGGKLLVVGGLLALGAGLGAWLRTQKRHRRR